MNLKLPPKLRTKKILILLCILAGAMIVGVGSLRWNSLSSHKKNVPQATSVPTHFPSPTSNPSPTLGPSSAAGSTTFPTPIQSVATQVDCVGPDGKRFKTTTQKACDDFNKAWVKATPVPTSSHQTSTQATGCALYDSTGSLGQLTVTIQPQAGQSIVGDTLVRIDRKYRECQGVDPGWPDSRILSEGQVTATFGGMRPGPFVVEVSYHGNKSSYDVSLHSGDNTLSVTISN